MLAKFRDDIKDLRSIWAENLKINPMDLCTEEERNRYMNQKIELEHEIARRQELGENFKKVYDKIYTLFELNARKTKDHIGTISYLLDETKRCLSFIFESLMNQDIENNSEDAVFLKGREFCTKLGALTYFFKRALYHFKS